MKLKDFIRNRTIEKSYTNIISYTLCGVCNEVGNCYTDVISDTFTNLDQLSSPYICSGCACLFANTWRKTAFYITEKECRKIQQRDFFDLLFGDKIIFPCLLSFSESRKKHRMFRSKISYSPSNIHVSTDEGEVIFDVQKDKALAFYLNKLYNTHELSKEWIETGEFPTPVIKKIGLPVYLEFKKKTKGMIGTNKYHLIVCFLNKL